MMPLPMMSFSVEPGQLSTAAEALARLATSMTQTPALGYTVTAAEFGAEPLVSAVGELQEGCDRAMRTLVDDLSATAVNLRRTFVDYVTADTDVAADLTVIRRAGG